MAVTTHPSGPLGGPWLFLASKSLGSVPTSAPLAFDRTFRKVVSIYGPDLQVVLGVTKHIWDPGCPSPHPLRTSAFMTH